MMKSTNDLNFAEGDVMETYSRITLFAVVRKRECTNVPGLFMAKLGSTLPFCTAWQIKYKYF